MFIKFYPVLSAREPNFQKKNQNRLFLSFKHLISARYRKNTKLTFTKTSFKWLFHNLCKIVPHTGLKILITLSQKEIAYPWTGVVEISTVKYKNFNWPIY